MSPERHPKALFHSLQILSGQTTNFPQMTHPIGKRQKNSYYTGEALHFILMKWLANRALQNGALLKDGHLIGYLSRIE